VEGGRVAEERVTRKLAAILATDMVGYSRLMEKDEEGTIARQKAHRGELIDPNIAEHGGRIVKSTGDGLLVEFASAVDAVRCAAEIQHAMADREANVPKDRRIAYRVGINIGDIVIDGEDILGDGVNIAARLEAMAGPGGVCVSGTVHEHVAGKLDLAFDDMGEQKVKNIERPVRAYRVQLDGIDQGNGSAAAAREPILELPDKPSIAVLPFDNLSSDPEQAFFADGITEDIITTLSKIPGLLVVARNSTFVYKGRSVDAKQVGAEQGVRFVLEGSVRKSGDRVRITAQLIDAASGHHIWADRYDREVGDIFALQDEITLKVVTELQVELMEGEMARVSGSGTENVEAWGDQVRAVACTRVVAKESFAQARKLAERAVAIDPGFAAPLATLAWAHWVEGRSGWSEPRDASVAKARELASQALALDPYIPEAHGVLGLTELIEGRHVHAIAKLKTALDLSPNHADLTAYLAAAHIWNGEPGTGIGLIRKAMRLSPIYPAWYIGLYGFALRLDGRYEDAIDALRKYGRRERGSGLVDLAIIYAESDDIEAAQREAKEVLRHRTGFTIAEWARTQMYRDPARLDRDIAALRVAGLPE
jgi:adenylate cyclase